MQGKLLVSFKKEYNGVPTPAYAKDGDAGLDLTAVELVKASNYVSYKTGISVAIPRGYVGLLFPRSSISKKDLVMANSVGIIDSGYRDEIEVRFKILGKDIYDIGERIAQLVILPYPTVELVDVAVLSQEGNRGGGFGSTNK